MAAFEQSSVMPASAERCFAWHARPGAFERLVPPTERIEVLEREGTIRDGDRLVMDVHIGPIPVRWVALHTGYREGRQFCDEQLRGPFRRWFHTHRFEPIDSNSSRLVDQIEYEHLLGPVGRALDFGLTHRKLTRMFRWRHARTRRDLQRQTPYDARGPLRIAIAGGSGLIGQALRAFLETAGHEVWQLVRGEADSGRRQISWKPADDEIDPAALERFDALINLAGESIAAGRWSERRKEAILDSRVASTELLARTLARLKRPPHVFLNASAVGIYGSRGGEMLDEDSPAGEGFLPDTCRAWEAGTQAAGQAGIRVVMMRFGVALSGRGGALAKMLKVFRAGVGGVLGSGEQYMSWVALEDVVGAIHHLLHRADIRGPVNVVSPWAVTNREFTRVLGKVLRRPTILAAPAIAIRAALGEMGQRLLLEGQRVAPKRLEESGFRFECADLEDALRWELGIAAPERA